MSNKILAIETSCDETSIAVIEKGTKILSNIVASQINIHQKYGGVVPEIASRYHLEQVNIVLEEALREANCSWQDLTAIGVTYGPGLVGALLVGVSTAKALSFSTGLPLIGVNHIEGHVYANWLEHGEIELPALCLVVSGGHTAIVKITDHCEYELLGQTRDDAAGEAFDKVARAVGLGYPGGPLIDKLAPQGDPTAYELPRAWLEEHSLDFSFSGIKSAVLNLLNRAQQKGEEIHKANLAASFQAAVVEVLVEKTGKAIEKTEAKTVLLAGGVAANSGLRAAMSQKVNEKGIKLLYPSLPLCTDNAAMIGAAAYYRWLKGERANLYLNAVPNLKLY